MYYIDFTQIICKPLSDFIYGFTVKQIIFIFQFLKKVVYLCFDIINSAKLITFGYIYSPDTACPIIYILK